MAAAANNIGNNVIDGHEDDDFLWDDDDDDEPIVDSRALSETWKANSNFCRGAAKVGIVRSFFVISDIASFVSSGDNVQTTLFKVGGFRWRFNVNIFEDEEPSIYSAYLGRIIGGNTNAVRRIREYASLTLSKKPMSRAIVIGFEAWVVAADGHRVRLSSMAEVGAGELWLLEGKTATLGIDRFIAVRDIDAATSAAAGLVDSDGRLTIGFRMFWIENRTMKLGSRWQDPDGSDEDEKSVQTKLSHDEPMSRDDFADVILVSACGKEFNAHKAVLASRSPIFAEMIRSANSSGGQARPAADQSDQIKLAVPNLDSETIEAILNYMYNVVSDPVVGRAYWTAIEQRKHQGNFNTGVSDLKTVRFSPGPNLIRHDICRITFDACSLNKMYCADLFASKECFSGATIM